MRKESGSLKLIPKMEPVAELTDEGIFKPTQPNVLRIGDPEKYLNDVIAANITIASSIKDKEVAGEVDELFATLKLPKPVKYTRKIGKREEEIGFMAEEMPEILKRGNGYDLKALIAYLAWKLLMIENSLQKR